MSDCQFRPDPCRPVHVIDIKYALIGTALGVAISAGFLALKICMIRKHLFDFDSSDLRSANVGVSDTITSKKRAPR
ncbi:hypothetical protein D623_10007022 [Myotis brandtii]|uniref:Transmembrane protein 273 n=1 Tax=Myotis brandtii TaxID=109478 RepID=S7P1S2_MYOBR|nr:hypothetical protein D623_10007022 [Myotis brandtii]